MSESFIIGLAIGIPIVVGALGYTVFRTVATPTSSNNSSRSSDSSTRSSESGVFRYPNDDRQSIQSVNPDDNQGYGWSNESDYSMNPPTSTYVGGKKSKRKRNKKNKTKKK
jgi:hypothetical protein